MSIIWGQFNSNVHKLSNAFIFLNNKFDSKGGYRYHDISYTKKLNFKLEMSYV